MSTSDDDALTGRRFVGKRRSAKSAATLGDFAGRRGASGYAQGMERVIVELEGRLKAGHAAEVVELVEEHLAAAEAAMQSIDDSGGRIGEILVRLQSLHLAACRKAKPDPEALARRIFAWELNTDFDTFYGAAETYAKVFGAKGLAVYRELANAEWADVLPLTPGRSDPEQYGKRFRITHIMEALARLGGDVEALVKIKERDLSSAYHYLQIAKTYREADDGDQALAWAERGMKAFPERTDGRLRDFLADEYHRRDRHDEAMKLVWANYEERPTLDQYQNLKQHADRFDGWAAWRAKAFAHLRNLIAKGKRPLPRKFVGQPSPEDHSAIVEVLLWEEDVDAAWREAQEGGCSSRLEMELADARQKDHPEDSLTAAQRHLGRILAESKMRAYRWAVDQLHDVRAQMIRLKRGGEFPAYLASVRATYKAKRNFLKLLDKTKWE